MNEDESRAATEELFRRLADADGGDGPLAWEAWDGSSATVARGGRRFLLGVAEVARQGAPGRRGSREVLASVRRLSPAGIPEGPEVLVTPAASAVLAVALPEESALEVLRRVIESRGWRAAPGSEADSAVAEARALLGG